MEMATVVFLLHTSPCFTTAVSTRQSQLIIRLNTTAVLCFLLNYDACRYMALLNFHVDGVVNFINNYIMLIHKQGYFSNMIILRCMFLYWAQPLLGYATIGCNYINMCFDDVHFIYAPE